MLSPRPIYLNWVSFMLEVMVTPISYKFKMPNMGTYNGTNIFLEHMENLKGWNYVSTLT